MTLLKAKVKKEKEEWWDFDIHDDKKIEIEYMPGPGTHSFIYKGKKIWVFHKEDKQIMTGWNRQPTD